MNKSFIEIGGCYSNGNGRIRKVLDIGPQYKYYSNAHYTECLCYMVLNDGTKKNKGAGEMGNISMRSFCSWAKEKVETMPVILTFPAIAYMSKDGKGMNGRWYPQDDPFLEEDFSSVQQALDRAEEMKADGYQHVTVFAVPVDLPIPEILDWEYVQARVIHTVNAAGI